MSRQSFTIKSNFTCSFNQYGIKPTYVDYYVHNAVNNNGHEPQVLISHHTDISQITTFQATVRNCLFCLSTKT
jgi:hypothetical protein